VAKEGKEKEKKRKASHSLGWGGEDFGGKKEAPTIAWRSRNAEKKEKNANLFRSKGRKKSLPATRRPGEGEKKKKRNGSGAVKERAQKR